MSQPLTPGALLGYTKHNMPIYLIGGGSQPTGEPPAPVEPPAALPAPTQPPAPATPAEDVTALPDWAQKALRDARSDAAKSRTSAKQTAAEEARQEILAQVAKSLGIGEEGAPVDPAQLTQHLESAQAAAWRSSVELAVFRSAGSLGGDPEKLLDSLAFVDSLDDLVSVDPSSQDFRTALEAKVREAIERNPAYRSTQTPTAPRPDPSQGPRNPGAPQRPKSLSEAVKAAWDASKQTPGR